MLRSHPGLHFSFSAGFALFAKHFTLFAIRMAVVALISLDPLAPLKEVGVDFVKYFNVGILTSRVDQVPCQNINAQLVAQTGLSRVKLWDAKVFPFFATLFWGIQKSVPLTVIVQPLPTLWVPNLLLKTICGIGGGGNGGGDDGCGEKKTNAIPILGFVKRGWLVVLPLTYLSALSFSSHSAPSSQCDLLTTVSTRLAMVLTKA